MFGSCCSHIILADGNVLTACLGLVILPLLLLMGMFLLSAWILLYCHYYCCWEFYYCLLGSCDTVVITAAVNVLI